MKTIIHVNQQKIQQNRKYGTEQPVITVKTYKDNRYGHEAIIYGQDGKPAAKIVYSPRKPLSCGARVWIETQNEVEVIAFDEEGLNKQEQEITQCNLEESTAQVI